MRKLLGTAVLVLVVVGIIGVSRNWFSVERTQDGSNTEVRLHIDRDKIRQDREVATDAAREIGANIEKTLDERRQR